MYGTARTKVLTVYGKRKQRVVAVPADENEGTPQRLPHSEPTSNLHPVLLPKNTGASPKIKLKKHVVRLSNSPTTSPWTSFHRIHRKQDKGSHKETPSPRRTPFADVMNSPLMKKKSSYYSRPAKPPIVSQPARQEVNAISISDDEAGQHIRRPILSINAKRRVVESPSTTGESSNGGSWSKNAVEGSPEKPIVISSGESSVEMISRPIFQQTKYTYGKPTKRPLKAVVDVPRIHTLPTLAPALPLPAPITPLPIRNEHPIFQPVPPPPKDLTKFVNATPLGRRTINVSPRRTRLSSRTIAKPINKSPLRKSLLPAAKKNPPKVIVTLPPLTKPPPTPAPAAKSSFQQLLAPILTECGQAEVMEFDFFLGIFTAEDFFTPNSLPRFHSKVGEATYSEVFGCGDFVLKIIPLRDPTREASELVGDDCDDWPTESEADDVCREISTTRALGDLAPGFVKMIKSYVVKGKYPKKLLSLWDAYEKKKGSENVRPHCMPHDQHYAIIVLPNGGPDLESYDFKKSKMNTKHPWRKAHAIFWQVVRALERAEDVAGFEHRDLHWGQILVKDIEGAEDADSPNAMPAALTAGIKVTIIDLGLARMDGYGDEQRWTVPEEEVFEGEGDYQFEVYRMMKAHNNGEWCVFCPLTNVMWLHYLVSKLLQSKRIRVPPKNGGKRKSGEDGDFSEHACYSRLLEVEEVLEENVTTRSCRLEVTKVRSARDLWSMGMAKGWVK